MLFKPTAGWIDTAKTIVVGATSTVQPHGARHITGSSYVFDGANQKMIATLLGHANTGSTERYTHLQVAQTQPLVEARWARLVGKASAE